VKYSLKVFYLVKYRVILKETMNKEEERHVLKNKNKIKRIS